MIATTLDWFSSHPFLYDAECVPRLYSTYSVHSAVRICAYTHIHIHTDLPAIMAFNYSQVHTAPCVLAHRYSLQSINRIFQAESEHTW